ncbi:MAG TPA: TIGR03936 family radical SAM-associated protein [Planctomycetota bacterium]|nr:TIGR03936 family radical SAM-associated protein [Planctomycetota bacterium]HRR80965.1 TIGR03936 family radical SAM-associated protein [Planctomycetota bacterium]HRT94651.1 TIGR03936 family radical SAM-associated protein [Planctomycetota bacterium]
MDALRVLVRFAKEGDARWLSHRDLMRLFERALRRAGLPVRMTQGFNPHPKLSIAAALPLGLEACDEALEVELEPTVSPDDVLRRLGEQLPNGVRLRSAAAVPHGARARVASLEYEAELPPDCPLTPGDLESARSRATLPVRRANGEERDVRPALLALNLEAGRLRFEVAACDRGTPRAAEVLAALLGDDSEVLRRIRLRRTRVSLMLSPPGPQSGTGVTRCLRG